MKQNETFLPSPEQIKFADRWLDYNQKQTLEDVGNEIGVSRTTIWRWFKDKNFIEWLNEKKESFLASSLMDIYKTAVRKAIAGDYQFARMLLEILKEYTPALNHNISIKITETVITHVVEVINKYILDEDLKKKIGEELAKVNLN